MKLTLIVCMARNRVIGRDGKMPWRMPTDLKHFRVATLGKPVIMGRKTYDSIGKPLPGRFNIVVSRQAGLRIDGVQVVGSIEQALDTARATGTDEAMVAGGGVLYAEAMPRADRILMTELAADLSGDTVFPDVDARHWHLASRTPLATGPGDDYAADVLVYERTSPKDHST